MSQTLRVENWCDNTVVHETDAQGNSTTPATSRITVLNEEEKPVIIDVCPDCRRIVLPVYELAKLGREAPSSKRTRYPDTKSRDFPCAFCEYAATSRERLSKHTNRQHDVGLSENDQELKRLGRPPLPAAKRYWARVRADTPRPYTCAVPDCGAPATSESAVYQHAGRWHDMSKSEYVHKFGVATPTPPPQQGTEPGAEQETPPPQKEEPWNGSEQVPGTSDSPSPPSSGSPQPS